MLLFVGLGNPGKSYAGNRHNIGFMAVDEIARTHNFPPFRAKFQGLASEGAVGSERVILLKPTTYMNESGRSVGEATKFYKIALKDIIVFHDELDLAAGKLRVKIGGGNAGHNGLRSITAHLGNDYKRVRLGIGHPGDKALVHNHVLSDFAKSEQQGWVGALNDAIARNAEVLARGDDPGFQNKVHLAMAAAGFSSE
jgi:PTH1 family peptidyl-tRNA hydrolase